MSGNPEPAPLVSVAPWWLRGPAWVRELLPGLLAIIVGLALAGLLSALLGVAPTRFYALLFTGTLGSGFGIGQVLYRATPLIFTGLSVAFAFRAGLFNIGAEGQMAVGALAMAWAGALLPWPPFVGAVVALSAGAVGGALWGAIPGVLKARTGSHEVIVTLLLNFVAFALVNYVLVQALALPETVRTQEVAEAARLVRLDAWLPALRGSPVSLALFLGIAGAIFLEIWIGRSTAGFSLQVLGEGLRPARYAGLSVERGLTLAMTGAGALAGLAGAGFVLGFKHYFEEGLTSGAGFLGIGVALLARNRPVWILPSALFFGMLSYGGFVVNRLVPRELLDVLQAIILLLFILFDRAIAARGTR
ncbi:MAG: ABC transporter permease [Candidatus Eisenbacteria bacterium]|uniref:ABC transporter permease n=1 Tax=Eiseniibacteriota bacterium TaxID=2212470 RepID=A0A956M4F3_UNCEI|nr:ABC transporter permease [Candidatus Eisenbacteria bacterium]